MKLSWITVLAVGSTLMPLAVQAEDWSQWRGPKRDAVSTEKGLLKEWPKEGPKLLWHSKDAGYGFGSLAVTGNRVYLVASEGKEKESVRALDAKTGKPIWSTPIGKVGNPDQTPNYPAARSTPTIDGKFLYALGSDGDLACLEIASGKVVWKKSFRNEFGGRPGIWAYSESPLVDGDKVIACPGGEKASIVAFDKRTGNVAWKAVTPDADMAGYASLIVVEVEGVKQYVAYLSKGLFGVDAKTGGFLWRYDKSIDTRFGVHASTPIASGSSIYSAAATGGGLALIKGNAGTYTADSAYAGRKVPNALGGAVKVGDYLFGSSTNTLLCIEYGTGRIRWEDRSVGAGSICAAEGLLYLHGEDGAVALIEATPAGYKERGRFTPNDIPSRGQAKAWAYPAIANGRLYIRDGASVWCYDIRK